MDLKNIPFPILLILLGTLLILLGAGVQAPVGQTVVKADTVAGKTVSAIVGLGLLIFGIALEIRSRRRAATTPPSATAIDLADPHASPLVSAATFFYTIEDEPSDTFSKLVRDASRVSIVSRTGVNLLSQYSHTFQSLVTRGCPVRLLLLDPSSEACAFVYGGSPDLYRRNIATASQHIERLRKLGAGRFEVRTTKHAPTISMIIVEQPEGRSNFMSVQLYFLHSRIGSDRPLFRLAEGDKWYSVFCEEFESLWNSGTNWPDITTQSRAS